MAVVITDGSTSDDVLITAARITVVFLTLYSLTFVNVLHTKKRLLRQQRERSGKKFDRYNSPDMHAADRLQSNFLEWCPVFLGLLWSLAATNNLSSSSTVVAAAWIYVALRALYVVLVLRYGVNANGMQQHLWISTFPAYGCLAWMGQHAIRSLFLAR